MGGGEIEEKRVFEFSTIIMQIFDATNIHWICEARRCVNNSI